MLIRHIAKCLDPPLGVDLSKILGASQNIGEMVVITDESIGVFQLLGVCARAGPPKSTPTAR